jgi:glycylpeptide N-tetradecanoyltransferase
MQRPFRSKQRYPWVIRQKHGSSTTEALDEAHVRMALDKLRIMDVLKGKSGIGGKNRKEMGEHKFWATQPVPQLGIFRLHILTSF